MAHRYSKKLLHELRHHVDVALLIRDVLELQAELRDGLFRFRCPRCRGFDCNTNPRTNLARCFHCQKNFNPIDLVMIVQRCSFTDAVDFLLQVPRHEPASGDEQPSRKTN